jgi:hypothetical protein
MKESMYEKYVTRTAEPGDPQIAWGRPDLGVPDFFNFIKTSGPLKETDSMFQYAFIYKDCVFGVTPEKAPHKHDCDEFFVFTGSNPQDKTDLGCEVEFWMGEGESTEKIKLHTSSVIFVPKNVLHLPVFFRNVKRPSVMQVIVPYDLKSLKTTAKFPVRGV